MWIKQTLRQLFHLVRLLVCKFLRITVVQHIYVADCHILTFNASFFLKAQEGTSCPPASVAHVQSLPFFISGWCTKSCALCFISWLTRSKLLWLSFSSKVTWLGLGNDACLGLNRMSTPSSWVKVLCDPSLKLDLHLVWHFFKLLCPVVCSACLILCGQALNYRYIKLLHTSAWHHWGLLRLRRDNSRCG